MLKSIRLRNKVLSIPIIQGGMGVGISLSNLAGAVMKEGALGVISAAQTGFKQDGFFLDSVEVNCNAIKDEIKKAREIANNKGVLGINIMVASKNYDKYVKAAVEAQVDVIISGAGLALDLPKYTKESDIALAPIVSSGKAFRLIAKTWDKKFQTVPDFVVIEGSEAGGHLGFKKEDLINDTCTPLNEIFVDVKKEVLVFEEKYNKKIPIFLAGGIFTGEDIANAIKLGADGVQMGTRFIATDECDAHINFKNAIVNCQKEDIEIVHSPSGFPGRGLGNEFIYKTREIGNISMTNCLDCLETCTPIDTPYCISLALIEAAKGNLKNGLIFVGANAYRVNKIVSVKELINELVTDANKNLV